jgi:hypothetical protein
VTTPIFALPSTGSKGQVLIVDSHFDPLRRFGDPADGNPLDDPVEDLSLGVELTVRRVGSGNRWVVIRVRAARADNTP